MAEPTPFTRTTPDAMAKSVVGSALGGIRRKVELSSELVFPNGHIGAHAVAKRGKTHLGLSARSSEVWLKGPVVDMKPTRAELLMPSLPMRIVYANFDRPADTVFTNLEKDSEIFEEVFYEDEDGMPVSIAPTVATVNKMLTRLGKLMDDTVADVENNLIDMFVTDGGTIIYDNARDGVLSGIAPGGVDADGAPRHVARQYGPVNNEMRGRVMQRLYGMACHTYITREARALWASQNGPVIVDGKTVMQSDGWNKHDHYVDIEGIMDVVTTQMGAQRTFRAYETATNALLIGRPITSPTYALIYAMNFKMPFLRKEQRAAFTALVAEHGWDNLTWDGK